MKYDLNLLRTFDTLMAERNVTAAARRLGTTQPAVSGALARLRDLFADPLFTRVRYGIVPTPRAIEIAPTVRQALHALDALFYSGQRFDPRAAGHHFQIAADPYCEWVLIPRLAALISQRAPGVQLTVVSVGAAIPAADLEAGPTSLALGRFVDPPPGLITQGILSDEFCCLVRAENPLATSDVTTEHLEAMKHVVVASAGLSPRNQLELVAAPPMPGQVAVSVANFAAAIRIIAATDYCALLPRRIAHTFAADTRFRILALTTDCGRFPIHVAWHSQHRHDDGHRWLRELLREVCDSCRSSDHTASP